MRTMLTILMVLPFLTVSTAKASVSGQISGFETVDNNNVFDFGLALPVLTKAQILDFNLDMFLSNETDTITALGQSFEVPSNLSIPRQRERYFFSIRFNKPSYKLPWNQTAELDGIGALEGQFGFRQVIDKVRGGAPLFTLVNDFVFTSFSLKEVNNAVENLSVGDVTHSHIMRLNGLTSESSPYITLAIALDSEDKNHFFPIDLKLLSLADSPPLRVTLNSHAALAIIPKSIFSPATLKNSSRIEMPFSIIWKAKLENNALPMLTDLVSVNGNQLNINAAEVSRNHNIIGYKLSLLNASGEQISSSTVQGRLPNSITIPQGQSFQKVRLDVYASGSKKSVSTKNELIEATDFIARYEKNI